MVRWGLRVGPKTTHEGRPRRGCFYTRGCQDARFQSKTGKKGLVLGSCNYKLGLNSGKEFKTLAKTSLSLSSDRKHTFLLSLSLSLSLSIYTQTPSTSHTLAHKRTLSVSFERCPLPLIICLTVSHSLPHSRTLSHSLTLSRTVLIFIPTCRTNAMLLIATKQTGQE